MPERAYVSRLSVQIFMIHIKNSSFSILNELNYIFCVYCQQLYYNTKIFEILCFMFHVSCFMFDVSCFMFHVSLFMFHVSCFMFDASCFMFHVSCLMFHISCFMFDV